MIAEDKDSVPDWRMKTDREEARRLWTGKRKDAGDIYGDWWLRGSVRQVNRQKTLAEDLRTEYVDAFGGINLSRVNEKKGVRPAAWLQLKADEI